jgi:hypothetical protein
MSSHAAAGTIDHHHDPSTSTGIPNKKLMMWTFLASDCMFFGALISTHLIYRLHPAPGSPSPKQIFSLELTSFSTFILLMSSLMMVVLPPSSLRQTNALRTPSPPASVKLRVPTKVSKLWQAAADDDAGAVSIARTTARRLRTCAVGGTCATAAGDA